MKILFLSQRFLLPMDTGGKIRTGNLLKQISRHHEVTLISNVESPRDDPHLCGMEQMCARFVPVPWVEQRRYTVRFFARLALQMFSRYPVSVLNSHSATLQAAVDAACARERFDLAICDFAQSALEFRNVRDVPTVLFQHNVESVIAQRHVQQAGNPIARLFWWIQWRRMCSFESAACKRFDFVVGVSENDCDHYRSHYGVTRTAPIPTGVDIDYYAPRDVPQRPDSLVFCGSMDWLPNVDGIEFFVEQVMPLIRQRRPLAHLTVVGRDPSPAIRRLAERHEGVELTGWVADTRPYISAAAVFVVPLRIGGGTRLKIYEAMALGKPVVSTTIGAEGLPVTDGDNVLLADEPEPMALRIVELLEDAGHRARIGENGCRFVRENFAWPRVAEVFMDLCREGIRHAGRRRRA